MFYRQLVVGSTIRGYDYFGRKTSISFFPTPDKTGWWFANSSGVPTHLITAQTCYHRHRHLTVVDPITRNEIRIWEHIGSLRYLGLDSVAVYCESGWPPYHGRAWEIWQVLKERSVVRDCRTSWFTIPSKADYSYKGGRSGSLSVAPKDRPSLDLKIEIDYPGLGWELCTANNLSFNNLEKALQAHTQGWPRWYQPAARVLRCLAWPHYDKVTWPQDHEPAEAKRLFAQHRLADLVGALSLMVNPAAPHQLCAVDVHSDRAGHEADLELLGQLSTDLGFVPLTSLTPATA